MSASGERLFQTHLRAGASRSDAWPPKSPSNTCCWQLLWCLDRVGAAKLSSPLRATPVAQTLTPGQWNDLGNPLLLTWHHNHMMPKILPAGWGLRSPRYHDGIILNNKNDIIFHLFARLTSERTWFWYFWLLIIILLKNMHYYHSLYQGCSIIYCDFHMGQ